MTWQERIQKYIKKHKKKTTSHTLIGTIIAVVVMLGYNLFDYAGASSLPKDQNVRITIGVVGDMMFGRCLGVISDSYGYEHLCRHVQPYLNQADMMCGNFENPITHKGNYHKADKKINFKTKAPVAGALGKVGFKVLNLANNHIKDFGKKGLLETVETFKKAKVDTVGAGENIGQASKISYRTVNELKVATIGMSDILPKTFTALKNRSGVLPTNPSIILPLVAEAKANADVVLVYVHWGLDYDSGTQPRQRDLGHALIEAGADLVVGTGPHVLEPIEAYKDGVILYSMGNFIYDQGWSTTKETALVYYKILRDGTRRLEIHPMMIKGGAPYPVTGWSGIYRREKIFSQITQERMYTSAWDQIWKRQEDMIYRDLKGKRV